MAIEPSRRKLEASEPGVARGETAVAPRAAAAGKADARQQANALSLSTPFDRTSARLMVVALSLDIGGAERQISAILPGLARRGWPVTIYCTNRLGTFADRLRGAGIEVLGPPIERRAGHQNIALRLGAAAAAGASLYRAIRQRRPEIVHFFLPEPYIVGAPSAVLLGVPIRIMSRRGRNHYQRKWPGAATIEQRLHRHMTAVVANSRRVVADLLDEGCEPARVAMIYNGVGLDGAGAPVDRAAVRRSLGLPEHGLVVIVVASLIGYKGHSDLLRGLAGVAAELPQPWSLVCVGRDEGEGPELARQARAHGFAGNVHFLGARNDVATLLGASDLAVLPSHEEGFANAVIEGMAAGLPVLATDVGGNPEAVVDGETGFIVPPHDPSALGAAVLRLARDPSLRAAFGRAGRQRAEQHFTLEACITAYDELYRRLLAGEMAASLPSPAVDVAPSSSKV